MSLREKSDEEISELLAEYGIKHGPIVDSTRRLYEKKLEEAMENTPAQPSSDKTYYREEEEEVTYITYHTPVRQEVYSETLKRRGHAEPEEEEEEEEEGEEESDQDTEPPIQSSKTTANHSAVRSRERSKEQSRERSKERSKEPVRKSGSCMWKFIRLLLLLAVLAAAGYFVYYHVLNNEENPFGIQFSD
ncbi:emerin (Emery-Dreifuss muscular dystrophy) [Plectropomus leopardus]|uniref:emerin (Emery-Dreifuss muscular dystrophy) n=1 Tax=Plectropomus leopardus TaxID=160734 RepID=UPI001C4C1D24|nr:emerin (Emery-Dreifuss muscular dystrophy) [Plectropomus leopardus]